ncbi:MAG: hypothetical protein LBH00_09350 [Planctomycetaceae bacterium]|jgi:hypothetical protein|nr:hypothetical protein [Planctomycetaceae bacterium]
MKIPDETDWNHDNPMNLDVRHAKKNFFGKNLTEAEELLASNALYYQEDIFWMPPVPFQYYIHAYINYLLSEKSKDDTDGASCFINIIDYHIQHYPDNVIVCWECIAETLEHIRLNVEKFGWDNIYGDVNKRIYAINILYKRNLSTYFDSSHDKLTPLPDRKITFLLDAAVLLPILWLPVWAICFHTIMSQIGVLICIFSFCLSLGRFVLSLSTASEYPDFLAFLMIFISPVIGVGYLFMLCVTY